MFVPKGTEQTFDLLCEANGKDNYHRTVYKDFGHLDCYIGEGAATEIWPDLAGALARGESQGLNALKSSA